MRRSLQAVVSGAVFAAVAVVVPATPAAASSIADPVLYWNNVLLDTYRAQSGGSAAPGPLSRKGAMMHLAVYDAVNSITKSGESYAYYRATDPTNASLPHAIAYASYTVLKAEFPTQNFDDELAFAVADAGADVGDGRGIGERAGAAIEANRAGDGSANNPGYTPGPNPGDWVPTGTPAGTFPCTATTPAWGQVRPFALTSGSQFRPPLPGGYPNTTALLASSLYQTQIKEVRDWGGTTSTLRTADQTQLAHFWANDLDGTYKPPGQLFDITRVVSQGKALSVAQNARLFALVGMSMADAGIAAWDAKYLTAVDLWRPETGLHAGSAGVPAVPTWQPLSSNPANGVHFSPCFPAWVSGHATFGAAWAGAMKTYFGTDAVTFTAGTNDPLAAGVTRTFTSFSAAATENALSRIYLGVHYRFDADQGLSTGYAVANYAGANFLRPDVCALPGTACGTPGYRTSTQPATAYEPGTTPLALTGDDAVQQVTFPFPVKFYNQTYSSAWVDTNGQVHFGAGGGTSYPDQCTGLPNAAAPNGTLDVYCQDLIVDASASIRVATLGSAPNRRYVIEWNNPYSYGFTSRRINATVTFFEGSGDIRYNYSGISNAQEHGAEGVVVGLENPAGTAATQFLNAQPLLENNFAITFTPV